MPIPMPIPIPFSMSAPMPVPDKRHLTTGRDSQNTWVSCDPHGVALDGTRAPLRACASLECRSAWSPSCHDRQRWAWTATGGGGGWPRDGGFEVRRCALGLSMDAIRTSHRSCGPREEATGDEKVCKQDVDSGPNKTIGLRGKGLQGGGGGCVLEPLSWRVPLLQKRARSPPPPLTHTRWSANLVLTAPLHIAMEACRWFPWPGWTSSISQRPEPTGTQCTTLPVP